MPQPVSYNTGVPVSGSIQENNISYVVDGQNRDYRGGFGGLSWMSELPAENNVVFIGNSSTIGRGPADKPLFYPAFNNSDANVIYAANTLPGSPRNFTTTAGAYNWATTNNYFINNSNNPIPRPNADSLIMYVDANQPSSYPQTGTTWNNLIAGFAPNGTLYNGTAWDSKGWFVFDGTDDYVDTSATFQFAQTGQFSVCGLINVQDHSFRAVAAAGIIGKGHYYTNSWDIWLYNDERVFFETTGNTISDVHYLNSDPLTIGRWYFFAATYNNTSKNLWINGTQYSNTYTGTGGFTNGNNVLIARRSGDAYRSLIGSGSAFSIYSRALSPSEVKQNYFQSNIVTDGLVFMMDANNLVSYPKSGTLVYSLTGSLSGSLINGVGYNTGNGGSWVFDGTDDYIDFGPLPINSPLSFTNGNFTLEHWIKPTALQGGSYFGLANMILLKGPASTFNYATQVVDATSVRFYHRDINESLSNNTFTVPNLLNVCTHLVFSINPAGTQITLYVNGLLQETQNLTGNPITPYANDGFLVGGYYTQQFTDFIGNIYTNRIYSKALTATEVQQNYQATKDKFQGQQIITNGLVLNLDAANKDSYPGTGTTWTDLTGIAGNATLYNGVGFNSNLWGGSLSFDSVDDYSRITNPNVTLGTNPRTLIGWFRATNSVYGCIFGFGNSPSGTPTYGSMELWNYADPLSMHYAGGSISSGLSLSANLNKWLMAVLKFDGTTAYIQIIDNGTSYSNSANVPLNTTTGNFSINKSAYANEGGGLAGYWGISLLYNRSLSSTEITQVYNATKGRFGL
jgi:hypothetical protein